MTFPASSSRIRSKRGISRAGRPRKSDFVASLCRKPSRTPHVPGVSWRPHPAGVATRRPGRNSDGRIGPSRAPGPALSLQIAESAPIRRLQTSPAASRAGTSGAQLGSRYGRRVPDEALRWTVVTVGVAVAIVLFVKGV